MSEIPVYTILLPGYSVDGEPDHLALGKIVDDALKKYFLGQELVVRGVASFEHPDKSADELIKIIKTLGTDRYDPGRVGDRYENVEGKHIDFFGFPASIEQDTELFHQMIWGFYHSAKGFHGYPVRIDVVIIYDATMLNQVSHRYEGRDDIKDDGFAFKDPADKPAAVKGIFKILS